MKRLREAAQQAKLLVSYQNPEPKIFAVDCQPMKKIGLTSLANLSLMNFLPNCSAKAVACLEGGGI